MKLPILLAIALLISGCATPFNFPATPKNEPQKKYHHVETVKKSPKIIEVVAPRSGEKLEVHVGEEIETTYNVGLEQTAPKPSIWRRIIALGWGWVILMVLGLFFPPVAMIMGMLNRGISTGTKKIVQGVERGLDRLDDAEREKFKKVLSESYDDNTKKIVSKLKRQ